jgi:hypothetical protein
MRREFADLDVGSNADMASPDIPTPNSIRNADEDEYEFDLGDPSSSLPLAGTVSRKVAFNSVVAKPYFKNLSQNVYPIKTAKTIVGRGNDDEPFEEAEIADEQDDQEEQFVITPNVAINAAAQQQIADYVKENFLKKGSFAG